MSAMLIVVPIVEVQDVALAATAHHLTVEVVTLIATTVAVVLADVVVVAMTAMVVYVIAAATTIVVAALGSVVLWDLEAPIVTQVAHHAAIAALGPDHPIDAGSNSRAYVKRSGAFDVCLPYEKRATNFLSHNLESTNFGRKEKKWLQTRKAMTCMVYP
jgi:hypothetical protein